jgi:hypothetical protein
LYDGFIKPEATMKRIQVFTLVSFILMLTLACNIPVATGSEKMTPQKWTTTGDRRSFSGQYSCEAKDSVTLVIDENGIASLTTTGIVYVDYINCTPDPSGFIASYTATGLADPDSKLIIFTSCNDGGFNAQGEIAYQSGKPMGNVSCIHNKGDDAGETAMIVWVPADNTSP